MNRAVTQQQEQDIRIQMLNAFLSCPHRDTDQIKKIHLDLQRQDPQFYSRLASWYKSHGDIRDHLEVFAALLSTDPFLDNREVGLALFRSMPVFLKHRVLGFIKGKKVKIRKKLAGHKIIKVEGKKDKKVPNIEIEEKTVGLFKNVPTSFKKEVEQYLRWLESDDERFDGIALGRSKDLKALYASLSIKPSERAQQILFKKKYPDTSRMKVLKEISEATPDQAAELIVKNKVPYTTAVGLIDQMTPSVVAALVNNMSPQELINNISSLEDRGVMNNPAVKEMVEKKLEKAQKSANVAGLKSKVAKKSIKDEGLAEKLDKVADAQVKKHGVIRVPTAVFVDKSGSLDVAIDVGKNCAAIVSGASEAPIFVVAFDTMPRQIVAEQNTLSGWEKAFHGLYANGGTSIACAIEFLRLKRFYVDQIVVITDGDENNPVGGFAQAYPGYAQEMNVRPSVVVIRVGNWRTVFVDSLKRAGIDYEVYEPGQADYYSLPGLIPLLSKKSKLDLLMEIMDTPLLKRRPFPEGKKVKEKIGA
jgi:hypothetical protein